MDGLRIKADFGLVSFAQVWLTRALQALLLRSSSSKQAATRVAAITSLLNVFTDSPDGETRRAAEIAIRDCLIANRKSTSASTLEALSTWLRTKGTVSQILSLEKEPERLADIPEPTLVGRTTLKALQLVLAPEPTTTAPDAPVGPTNAADLLVSMLVVAHHPELGKWADHAWIDLAVSVQVDPGKLARDNKDKIVSVLQSHLTLPWVVS